MNPKKGELNLDVGKVIAELEDVVKEFKLKHEFFKVIFRGRGLEFDGYRNFDPDDDASDIDWKASNKSQKLLVKQYREERDLKIMFLIDTGDNMVFGSKDKIKCEYAAELAIAFAHIIINANDQIGLLMFNDKVNYFGNARGGSKQFGFFVDVLSKGINYGGNTNINKALDYAINYFDNSVNAVIVISDFLNVDDETKKKFSLLSSKFETIAIGIRDPLDFTLPDIGKEIILEDPLSSEQIVVNPKIAKGLYEKYSFQKRQILRKMFERNQIDFLDLSTNKSFAFPLAIFLKQRIGKQVFG